eukprot:gene30096-56084_t
MTPQDARDRPLTRAQCNPEENVMNQQEELREKRATFDWTAAQVWKGLFDVVGPPLVARVASSAGMGDAALDAGNSRQQAEAVGGLLRAMRHWRRDGDAAARDDGWRLVLARLAAALADGRLTALKDFGEALCFGATQQPDLRPVEDALVAHLDAATGMQAQARAVELIGRFIGQCCRT